MRREMASDDRERLARAVKTAKTCKDCVDIEPAPDMIRRIMGAVYFCPIHGVYVRADEFPCEHGTDESGAQLTNR